MTKLFIFGLGYAAQFVAQEARKQGYHVTGTHQAKQSNYLVYSNTQKLNEDALEKLSQADAVLISIPPDENGDKVFHDYADILQHSKNLKWLGLFSTTGVYGDTNGEWVDEITPVNPNNERSQHRIIAEQQWLSTTLPVHIFRLSGIYGPGRSAIDRAKTDAPIIEKSDHVFNRIHVKDIAKAIIASIEKPTSHEIYNLSDDVPAGGDEVLRYAYQLVGKEPPQSILFEQADLSPTAKEFYTANKRVNADKIKKAFGINWEYPDYAAGLKALLSETE